MRRFILTTVILWVTACTAVKTPLATREVHFGFDQDSVSQKDTAGLAGNIDKMISRKHSVYLIEGHTDKIGDAEYNLDLGDRRAQAIKAYLMEKGVAAKRLVTVTYGESKDKTQRLKTPVNRRVLIRDLTL